MVLVSESQTDRVFSEETKSCISKGTDKTKQPNVVKPTVSCSDSQNQSCLPKAISSFQPKQMECQTARDSCPLFLEEKDQHTCETTSLRQTQTDFSGREKATPEQPELVLLADVEDADLVYEVDVRKTPRKRDMTKCVEERDNEEELPELGNEESERNERTGGVCRNGEVLEEIRRTRGSVLRLSSGGTELQMEMGEADGKTPPKRARQQDCADECVPNTGSITAFSSHDTTHPDHSSDNAHNTGLSRRLSTTSSKEPIVVLSSEEEEEEEESRSDPQTQEGIRDTATAELHTHTYVCQTKSLLGTQTHNAEMHTQVSSLVDPALEGSPIMDLPFSTLFMGGVKAKSSGNIKITVDKVSVPLKDSTGAVLTVSLLMSSVRKYSAWEGSLAQGTGLVSQDETLPASVLLLWVSETQARRLHNDLSVIQPGTQPAEGSVCVLLCVSESLCGVQRALLGSIMDIVGLKHGTTELLSPLTHSDSLQQLHDNRDTNLLQLLCPTASTHTSKESEVQPCYTLCHSLMRGSYSVSMVTRPEADWTRYRHRGPARRLIQFPPPPSKGAITVTSEDLECLDSGEFLNDVIIDFYLKYLLVCKAPRECVERSHIFSSFFYKQLTRRDNANEDCSSTPAQHRRHQRVRTWTRHVDIFSKDFLFVPVNQEAHWYLVVICFPGLEKPQFVEWESPELVQSNGGESPGESQAEPEAQEACRPNPTDDISTGNTRSSWSPNPLDCTGQTCRRRTVLRRPCILIMDSLKLSVHERIFKLLREYLQVEWEVKRGGQRDFSPDQMVGSHCKVPLQDNSSDCGLYLLQYAESFLQDPVVHFDLPLRLERWFPRQQVRGKREEIRDLVLHLYRHQQGTLGNEGQEDSTDEGNVVL
ncbi:sentrin-specific protease 7 isoform X2 [Chanos chanos]|nr:sentrin-specific protease 7 isoform X2 [Chanos chanos]